MTELEKKIEQGNKRLAIVTCTESTILFIPLLFLIGHKYWNLFVIAYFILLLGSMLLAPKICNKIWKN